MLSQKMIDQVSREGHNNLQSTRQTKTVLRVQLFE